MAAAPNRILFHAPGADQLWVSDGTTPGTTVLSGTITPTYFTQAGGSVVFSAGTSSTGLELWVTDGKASGTSLLVDILPGANGSQPRHFATLGNNALFSATDASHGNELWITDGTAAGTSLLKDISPGGGSNGSFPTHLTPLGSHVLFQAYDGSHGYELWSTDGTAAGTTMVKDIKPGSYNSAPGDGGSGFAVIGDKAVFAAFDTNGGTHGRSLWVSDGTEAGTQPVKTTTGLALRNLTAFGTGKAIFTLGSSSLGEEPWVTDGTPAGTSLIKDVRVGSTSSGAASFAALNGQALFAAADGSVETASARAPFVTDGTTGATIKLANVAMDLNGFFVLGNTALFTAAGIAPATSYELWITDGTAAHTSPLRLSSLPAATGVSTNPAVMNNQLFFGSLSTSDGTQAGTKSIHAPIGFAAAGGFTAVSLPCFVVGTAIRTPAGDVAVEALEPGQLVLTHDGAMRPVHWIGHRHVVVATHPDPAAVRPIRVRAGAIAPGQPARDLLVSPDHALLLDGVLIPAHALVNGATVVRETTTVAVTYFHVELDRHDILLAEGLPAESYLDTGNRDGFANAEVVRLHADFSPKTWAADACAPHVIAGPQVDAARAGIAARAVALGWRREAAPDLAISADGRLLEIRPAFSGELDIVFPRGTRSVGLSIAAVAPADLDRDGSDRRPLGLCVTGVHIATASWRRALPLDDDRLGDGWHGLERDGAHTWRWTADDAVIDTTGLTGLRLTLGAVQPVWARLGGRAHSQRAR